MRRTTTWGQFGKSAALVLAFVAVGVGLGPTAHAAPPDTTDALVAVESEVLALVELGAFPEPLPAKLRDVADDWRSEVEGYTRSDLIDWLQASDEDAARELERLGGTQLSPDVRAALRRLPPDAVRAIESGVPIAMPASVYEHALNDLDYRNGSAPSAGEAAPAAGGGVAPRPEPRADGTPLVVVLGAGAAVVVAALGAAMVVWGRRRSTAVAASDSGVARLLDASRRFGSSVAVPDIHRILLEETVALTGADTAAVVSVEDGSSLPAVVTETTVGSLVPGHLGRGIVRRVLDTGVGLRTVAADAAIAGGPRAVLAVPLVRNGTIVGAVVALRGAEQPFDPADLDVLGQLAPMAAAALVSAGLHDNVAELSLTDGLTELGNRRRLDRDLVAALGAGSGNIGFVMVDIDHFKQFNDTHGHVAGDDVLQGVAALLRGAVRAGDVVYRYGGEEFCVLLPDTTPLEAADVSERLRLAVESHVFPGGETQPAGRVTISVGTTVASRIDPIEVKERADHALYEAKHRGRNQVVVESIVVTPVDE